MNKCKIKRFGILLSVCLGTAVLGACGKTSGSSKGNTKILFSINEMDTFRQTLADAAQKTASEYGGSVDVVDAQGVIETQVKQIQQAAADGYDAILCGPIDVDTTRELKTSSKDIPIIFVNSCPDDKYLVKDEYIYVGSSESVAGQYQAEYVLDKLASKDEINVALIEGPSGHSATAGRTKGVKKTFAASGKKINYIFEDHAQWSEDKAKEMFKVFLKTGKTADCVICNNDSMALGVVKACKENGVDPGSMLILGVDATADGCAAIQDGDMAFTVYQSGAGQGKAAVDAAVAIASGGSAKDIEGVTDDGKYVWVPFEKVDAGNVAEYMN